MTTQLTTLSGIPASEIPIRLAEPFQDPRAYKAVPGGADLTDINTGFMLERVNEVFGPKGLGWNLLFNKDDLQVFGDPAASKRLTVRLAYATFQYFLVDGDGGLHRFEIPTSGVNTNDFTYAEEGARTSALGAALKGMGFQAPIYKGLLDHHNASRILQPGGEAVKPAGTAPSNGKGQKATPAGSPKPAPAAAIRPAREIDDLDAAPDKPAALKAPTATAQPAPAAPGDFLIPIGKNAGKRLAEVSLTWIQWAAKDLQATSEATLALQAAARAFLEEQVTA